MVQVVVVCLFVALAQLLSFYDISFLSITPALVNFFCNLAKQSFLFHTALVSIFTCDFSYIVNLSRLGVPATLSCDFS